MGRIAVVAAAAVVCVAPAQSQAVIGDELAAAMSSQPNALHRIIIVFDGRRVFTPSEIANSGATRADRQAFVADEIVEFAQDQEADVMSILLDAQEGNDAANIQSLEVAYAIVADARAPIIEDIAEEPAVRYITLRTVCSINEDDDMGSGALPWGLGALHADEVWAAGLTGADVLVAVFDGGIDHTHDDLRGNASERFIDLSALEYQGQQLLYHGWDAVDGDAEPDYGISGHGTAAAGIVGGDGSLGTQTGMAPGVLFMDVKAVGGTTEPIGAEGGMLRGFDFLVDMEAEYAGAFRFPDVVSLSGAVGSDCEANQAVWRFVTDNLYWMDILVVAAAGNGPAVVTAMASGPPPWLHPGQSDPSSPPDPPLHVSGALAVGQLDEELVVRGASGLGPFLWAAPAAGLPPVPEYFYDYPGPAGLKRPDFAAPSVVLSTVPGDGYGTMTGTSSATPHVSGAIALLYQFNRDLTIAQVAETLGMTAFDVTEHDYHTPQADVGFDNASGAGMPDAWAALRYAAEHFGGTFPTTFVIPPTETWSPENVTWRFAPGAGLVVRGTLHADGVTFTEAEEDAGWEGIVLEAGSATLTNTTVEYADIGATVYDPAWLHTDGSTFRHNRVGIDVLSPLNTGDQNRIYDTDFFENGTAVRSDFSTCVGMTCSCLTPCRSRFTVENSCVSNSDATLGAVYGHGMTVRNADAQVTGTTATANDRHGILADEAEVRLRQSLLTWNGTTVAPDTSDGSNALAGADLLFFDPLDVDGTGGNVVHHNEGDEVHGRELSYVLLGLDLPDEGPPYNVVTKEIEPDDGRRYVQNNTLEKVYAEDVYWGFSTGAPHDAFDPNAYPVLDDPHLTSHPGGSAGDPGCPLPGAFAPPAQGSFSAVGLEPSRIHSSSGTSLGGEARGLTVREALRARIVDRRGILAAEPSTANAVTVLRELYALQRLDRLDSLGEREATMGLLGQLRARIAEPGLPEASRAVAEAALVAELDEAVRSGDYGGAATLVGWAAERVQGARALHRLRLVEITLDEQAGRYDVALGRIAALLATLPERDADSRRVLQGRAAVVAERWTGDAGGGFAASHVAAARTGAGTLPTEVALLAPRPNPAHGHALIPLELPTGTMVRVTVFDVLGRRTATLAERELEAGRHFLRFDGPALASGTYVVRADVGTGDGARVLTRRFTLLR